METVALGSTGRRVSRVGFGGCPIGGHGWGTVDDRESMAAVRRSLELGIDFFDTADVYGLGHSEEVLAAALGDDRSRVVVATKFGVRVEAGKPTTIDASRAHARRAIEASLRRLRLDCIPLYYLHWPDPKTPLCNTLDELSRLREEGKIRWIGVSNVNPMQLDEALSAATIDAVQVQFSLVDRRAALGLLRRLEPAPVTLVTWGSLAQGMLTGKYDAQSVFAPDDRRNRYENFLPPKRERNLAVVKVLRELAPLYGKTPAQLAMRWLLDTPGVGVTLFGAKTLAQVAENVGATGWRLSDEHYRRLASLDPDDATPPPAAEAIQP